MTQRIAFVDTHVHFYDFSHPSLRWDWLRPGSAPAETIGEYGAIQAYRYVAEDFLAETRFQNVEGVVHVQAALGSADPVEETRWLQAQADATGVPEGIVAHASLDAPDLDATLVRHAQVANLRAVRDLRYDGYLSSPDWLRGLDVLERHGLMLCDDPLVEHMALLAAAAREHPALTICVDHAGFPRRRDDVYFREWRAGMEAISRCPNTVVKISGLGMCDHRWTLESIRPWVRSCLELWGPERAFFGTNWPVDRLFSSYGDVLDAYLELISDFSPAEQAALFSGNAKRLFALGARQS
jgi:predicted TIM-barrel fold metal-dependent hydrolase